MKVTDGQPLAQTWRALWPHERLLLALAIATLILLFRAGSWRSPQFREVAAAACLFLVLILVLRGSAGRIQKLRLLAAYAFILWFYLRVGMIVSACGSRSWDRTLLTLDRGIFGETPAVLCESIIHPALTDLFSACYLSYQVYLHAAIAFALWQPLPVALRFFTCLYSAFAVGFLGYLLVPAIGPELAFPHLFSTSLKGGTITELNDWVVVHGSSVFDVFPSLHVLVTCVLLDYDWRELRVRFWLMLTPALGMFVSTVYLRYHYAVDLAAGAGLFLCLSWAFRRLGQPRRYAELS